MTEVEMPAMAPRAQVARKPIVCTYYPRPNSVSGWAGGDSEPSRVERVRTFTEADGAVVRSESGERTRAWPPSPCAPCRVQCRRGGY